MRCDPSSPRSRRPWAGLLLALAPLLAGCPGSGGADAPPAPATAEAPLPVSVTILPHRWIVERIGGEVVDVQVLVPPGASPELHQPSDAEVARVARSRLVLTAGVPVERAPWMEALRANPGTLVVPLARDAGADHPHAWHDHGHDHGDDGGHDHDHGDFDPHTWTDARFLAEQALLAAEALAEADPAGADGYRARADALAAELDALHEELAVRLAPCRGRAFLIVHPAWGHFAEAYGLEQVSVERGGSDPSDAELAALAARVAAEGLTAIVTQPQISRRAADALATRLGLEVIELDPLAEDPFATLRRAADALARAAGCTPAEVAP